MVAKKKGATGADEEKQGRVSHLYNGFSDTDFLTYLGHLMRKERENSESMDPPNVKIFLPILSRGSLNGTVDMARAALFFMIESDDEAPLELLNKLRRPASTYLVRVSPPGPLALEPPVAVVVEGRGHTLVWNEQQDADSDVQGDTAEPDEKRLHVFSFKYRGAWRIHDAATGAYLARGARKDAALDAAVRTVSSVPDLQERLDGMEDVTALRRARLDEMVRIGWFS